MFLLKIFIILEEPQLSGQLHVTSIKRPLVGGPRVTRLWRLNCIYLWDHSFAHDELKCYVVFQLNSVLESLLSKVARYDQGSILAPMFSLMVCIGLRGRRQKERERGGRGEEEEKKGKGNALFSPSPSPALSRLCACHFLHIFNRFVSWEIIIPPHSQTPFQRNLLTSTGTPRREISRVQLPTPELLEEWLQSLGAAISWIVWVIRG